MAWMKTLLGLEMFLEDIPQMVLTVSTTLLLYLDKKKERQTFFKMHYYYDLI